MAALWRGTEGSPHGPLRGKHSEPTLEYLSQCIPQVLVCVLTERVQVKRTGSCMGMDGYRKRRPWPVRIMTRGRRLKRVKTGCIERRYV